MVSKIQLVGVIVFGVWLVTVVVLAVISSVKGRKRDSDEGGGADLDIDGPTPGDWQ